MNGHDTAFTFFQQKCTLLNSQQVRQVFDHEKAIHLMPKCPKKEEKYIYNLTIYSHCYFFLAAFSF